jgi:putative ABC transport system ATP-binding protein
LIYEVNDLKFSYRLGNQRLEALRGVSLDIPAGAFMSLSGPSGSGKTTLLNCLGLIETLSPSSASTPSQQGSIRFLGRDLASLGETARNEVRKRAIGFVFQNFQLFPVLTAEENVEYFLTRQGLPRNERKERVLAALKSVGLSEHRRKKPLEMSGGQRQRVAIARALAKRPQVILADEPTASLDSQTGSEVMDLFRQSVKETGTTVIISSHDPMVLAYCPVNVKLHDGRIVPNPEEANS